MASVTTIVTRERAVLAGDACLVTAALFGVATGVTALILAPTGALDEDVGWGLQVLTFVLMIAVVVLGPVVAWVLHGRHVRWTAVLGGVVGSLVGSLLVGVLFMLVALFGMLVSRVTGSELAGPITMLALVGLAFLVLIVWLEVDAIRDLAPARRVHPRLDVVRSASVVTLVVVTAGSLIWTATHPGDESAELIAFAFMAGLAGALIATGAEVATNLTARRTAGSGAGASPV